MRRPRVRRGALLIGVATLLFVAVAVGVATAPATTRQGLNFTVSTHELPRYVKAWDFLDRHFHYQLLAREITHGLRTDEDRVLAVYRWTRDHIRPTPPDWPIVDDHILHIIIRGHGVGDQVADVFATLSTYAGVPACWVVAKPKGSPHEHVVSLARVDGRWVVIDVARGFVFRDRQGRLAALEELVDDPALVQAVAGDLRPGGIPYREYLAGIPPSAISSPLRAELQMPGPRVWYEIRKRAGLTRNDPEAQRRTATAVPRPDSG